MGGAVVLTPDGLTVTGFSLGVGESEGGRNRLKGSPAARGASTVTADQQEGDHWWGKDRNIGINSGTTLKQNDLPL